VTDEDEQRLLLRVLHELSYCRVTQRLRCFEGVARLRPTSPRQHDGGVPFTCEVCGGGIALPDSVFPDLIPPVGGALRCPHCADERPFIRPPLLIVIGTPGIGKSTLCARLAGTIPGAVLLDTDILGADLISASNDDYSAFWRSWMRLAHELAQNDVVVVYFAVMLPEQVLGNADILSYFESVHFLCLTCSPEVLRARRTRRDPRADSARTEWCVDFNSALVSAASEVPTATVVDAGRTADQVEHDVRHWIEARLHRRGP
jgi:hypothetical protein